MRSFPRLISTWIVLMSLLAGCGVSKTPKADTGADNVAKEFFESIRNSDWPTAYSLLDQSSRAWCSLEQFSKMGQSYKQIMNFQPNQVSVSVTESGDTASAVVVFREKDAADLKSFKDGTSLHRYPSGWLVVLRKNFGKRSAIRPPESSVGK